MLHRTTDALGNEAEAADNLLGGRAGQKFMHPYMVMELGKRFKLSTALRQGMLPVVWGQTNQHGFSMHTTHSIYTRKSRWRGSYAASVPSPDFCKL